MEAVTCRPSCFFKGVVARGRERRRAARIGAGVEPVLRDFRPVLRAVAAGESVMLSPEDMARLTVLADGG